jgi:DNA-binding MarR family transcriptional regulator
MLALRDDLRFHPLPMPRRDGVACQILSAAPAATAAQSDAIRINQVRSVIQARAERGAHFSAVLFSDPAWDILLELYLAELEQRRLAITTLGDRAGVPATTALRWIETLLHRGLLRREKDFSDARRFFATLTVDGFDAMNEYFGSLPTAALPL